MKMKTVCCPAEGALVEFEVEKFEKSRITNPHALMLAPPPDLRSHL
mgnify:CR=1 FL=1